MRLHVDGNWGGVDGTADIRSNRRYVVEPSRDTCRYHQSELIGSGGRLRLGHGSDAIIWMGSTDGSEETVVSLAILPSALRVMCIVFSLMNVWLLYWLLSPNPVLSTRG